VSFEIDKALALGIDDTNDIISQNMQMYLLAERLRRVKDAPLSEEIQPFTFTPLATDYGKNDTHTCALMCAACSAIVSLDKGKKYCQRCMVIVYCSKVTATLSVTLSFQPHPHAHSDHHKTPKPQGVPEGGLEASQEGVWKGHAQHAGVQSKPRNGFRLY
jgi:hypothetical protein